MTEFRRTLGQRIKAARDRLSFTQEDLAREVGFSAHQIVSQIETGEREIKAWELARLARVLKIEISDLLADEELHPLPVVLWRETPSEGAKTKEAEFLKHCQEYSDLEKLCEVDIREFPRKKVDPETVGYSDAEALAGEVSSEFCLGARPAKSLESILENAYGVKVWYEDLGSNGSAASSIGPFGSAILMNSAEAPWRRNYNFAHEVFHLLTWLSLPTESLQRRAGLWNRVESLANVFASNLLLPADAISSAFDKRVKQGKVNFADLIGVAREFDVSTDALLYRLQNLGRLSRKVVESVRLDPVFRALDRATMADHWWEPPKLPERFVRLAFMAYKKGKLSRGRLAQYLNTSLLDLTDTLLRYGFDDSQSYETEVRTA